MPRLEIVWQVWKEGPKNRWTEEFNKQISRQCWPGYSDVSQEERGRVKKGPMNKITSMEAYKSGPYATTPTESQYNLLDLLCAYIVT
jgi:hypothetical protein